MLGQIFSNVCVCSPSENSGLELVSVTVLLIQEPCRRLLGG